MLNTGVANLWIHAKVCQFPGSDSISPLRLCHTNPVLPVLCLRKRRRNIQEGEASNFPQSHIWPGAKLCLLTSPPLLCMDLRPPTPHTPRLTWFHGARGGEGLMLFLPPSGQLFILELRSVLVTYGCLSGSSFPYFIPEPLWWPECLCWLLNERPQGSTEAGWIKQSPGYWRLSAPSDTIFK